MEKRKVFKKMSGLEVNEYKRENYSVDSIKGKKNIELFDDESWRNMVR